MSTLKYDIITFHPGRQHNIEQAQQISKKFASYKHITSLYFSNNQVNYWQKISCKLGRVLQKRSGALSTRMVDNNPWPELKLLLRKGLGERLWYDAYVGRNDSFQKWILRNYNPPKICIGFDTCSWRIFEEWKNKSFLVLDLSIAIPQYKLALAKACSFSKEDVAKLTNDDKAVYDIYKKEIQLADLILCGSEFVKRSCISEEINPGKLVVLPYGIDLNKFSNPDIQPETERLKVVFIGAVTFRKGADIVLQSWKKIRKSFPLAELHFYGSVEMEIPEQIEGVFFHGFIPQETLVEELRRAHISVLPSFFEGSSLAIYQSMAMGLAIITTINSGSIIENDRNGFIINYGSEKELTSGLEMLLREKNLRQRLASNAVTDIREYSWDNYGKKLGDILENILNNHITPHNIQEVAYSKI